MAGLFSKKGLFLFFAKLQLAFTDMQENCSQQWPTLVLYHSMLSFQLQMFD